MDVGMLWFDNDKERDLVQKVVRASAYYRKNTAMFPIFVMFTPICFPSIRKQRAKKLWLATLGTISRLGPSQPFLDRDEWVELDIFHNI
ncbi:MAG: hypothetical protein HC806_07010 [Anaerolineae bacterium]|nr:hypothetical protein [Anaerolineae bacterium]